MYRERESARGKNETIKRKRVNLMVEGRDTWELKKSQGLHSIHLWDVMPCSLVKVY
jgi:hypothetical protein